MTKNLILTTSGFVLPATNYYGILDESKVSGSSVFDRKTFISTDMVISDYLKSGLIYHSAAANEAHRKYMATQSFEHYMAMVHIAADVLSRVPFDTFFELQASNRNLSPTSFMLCLDLYSTNFYHTYRTYETVPLGARFTAEYTPKSDNLAKLRAVKPQPVTRKTWENYLSALSVDRKAFTAFFRYVFVDAY